MRISVFGMGYVGCVTAACLVADGHDVTGVDIDLTKVALINGGSSPIPEKGVGGLIQKAVKARRLRVTSDAHQAVTQTDLSFVTVDSPSTADGSLGLQDLIEAITKLGQALRSKGAFHVVAIRSTMLPGSTEAVLTPILESQSNKRAGKEFGVVYNPEYLREGSAVADFRQPPRTVIGEADSQSGSTLAGLYGEIEAPLVRTNIRTAEMLKYVDNAFHAMKAAFANEIGALCQQAGVDGHRLMEIVSSDTRLNISPAYLRPGYAFGGPCLPKDLQALCHYAATLNVAVPLLASLLSSNAAHKQRTLTFLETLGKRRISILGLAFKEGTSDLRGSPYIELAQELAVRGYQVRVYDSALAYGRTGGGHQRYVEENVRGLEAAIAPSVESAVADAEVVIVTRHDPEFQQIQSMLSSAQLLLDLSAIGGSVLSGGGD